MNEIETELEFTGTSEQVLRFRRLMCARPSCRGCFVYPIAWTAEQIVTRVPLGEVTMHLLGFAICADHWSAS